MDTRANAGLEARYAELVERPLGPGPAALEALLIERSELDALHSEVRTELYIATSRRTDDLDARVAHERFIREASPRHASQAAALDRRILELEQRFELDEGRYALMLRDLEARARVFRAESLALEAELEALARGYERKVGSLQVDTREGPLSLPEARLRLFEAPLAAREGLWRAIERCWAGARQALDERFETMLALRQRVAEAADFPDFRRFQHARLNRHDYSPEDCLAFHAGVERELMPLLRALDAERAGGPGGARRRPWERGPVEGAVLRPFTTTAELVERSARVFHRLGPELGALFEGLRHGDCLDLDARVHKAPGGFQVQRQASHRPFIFMNATGTHDDLVGFMHECGHAFHALSSHHEPLLHYREFPAEYAELAAVSMELLALVGFDEFYSPAEVVRARRQCFEGFVRRFAKIAKIDAFQHWIYANPAHTRAQRHRHWLELEERFGEGLDWSGLDEAAMSTWQRQVHIYEKPFYFIEYAFAQLGALELWSRARVDPRGAVRDYLDAFSRAASRPLPELYAGLGVGFDLGPDALARAAAVLKTELS